MFPLLLCFAWSHASLTVSGGSGGAPSTSHFIRSSALLGKSPKKGQGQFTKQILDVTDTGESLQIGQYHFVLILWSVPIYDARRHLFNYAEDLEHVDSVLPKFDGEIPAGSFAIVAYTMSTYQKGSNHHLSTNVQFVILLKDYE